MVLHSETATPRVYTVNELTGEIQVLLAEHFDFVWVEGEISNFSAPVSGHYYMVLKDEKAQIRAVMFRLQARHLRFRPENGMKIIAQGRIGIYEVVEFDSELKEKILKGAAHYEIKSSTIAKGMKTIRQSGIEKIIKGVTTPEEVLAACIDAET
jgi:hypothetical protein